MKCLLCSHSADDHDWKAGTGCRVGRCLCRSFQPPPVPWTAGFPRLTQELLDDANAGKWDTE